MAGKVHQVCFVVGGSVLCERKSAVGKSARRRIASSVHRHRHSRNHVQGRGSETVVRMVLGEMETMYPADVDHGEGAINELLAETEAMRLLDWGMISARVARMASTELGGLILQMGVPQASTVIEAQGLLWETRETIWLLEHTNGFDFSGAADITAAVQIASRGGSILGRDLAKIADTLLAMRRNKRIVEGVEDDDRVASLRAIVAGISTKAELEQTIRRCVDSDGGVRDSASKELNDVRSEIRALGAGIRAEMNQIMSQKPDAMQDRIVTQRYDRYVLAVKASHKSRVPGIVHDSSSTGQTLYIEPKQVKAQNDKLRVLAKRDKAIVEKILRELSALVGESEEDLERMLQSLTTLDLAYARARHSMQMKAVEPKFVNRNDKEMIAEGHSLELIAARHPLLLWQSIDAAANTQGALDEPASKIEVSGDPWSTVIPSDYIFYPNVRCAIVTGPNTGGKTVCLKSLGVAVLMAKAGLFVCAEKATLPFFDKVLADLGDDQSIVQSLSTFSGHVERLKRVFESVTSESLVLLDEVGSGTDPTEGAALGMALLRKLADKVKLTLATTHHGELKTLKYLDEQNRFENASVQFDDEKMRPTYRLVWGIPGRSNALAIARRLGLDGQIIDDATDLLQGSSNADVNKVIAALEEQRAELERVNARLRSREKEVEMRESELQKQTEAVALDAAVQRGNMREEVRQEVEAAREKVREVIRTMQKSGGNARAAGDAQGQLNVLASGYEEESLQSGRKSNQVLDPESIKEGDMVRVARLGDDLVKVVDAPSPRGDVFVLCGRMKIKVKLSEVELTADENGSAKDTSSRSTGVAKRGRGNFGLGSAPKSMPVRRGKGVKSSFVGKTSRVVVKTDANTVDIRGERVDEGLDRVRDAINNSFEFGTLWVVHGHGTGALKNAVRDMLKRSKIVEKYTDAEYYDGGAGATVVYFR